MPASFSLGYQSNRHIVMTPYIMLGECGRYVVVNVSVAMQEQGTLHDDDDDVDDDE
jgi:hypothetical protein